MKTWNNIPNEILNLIIVYCGRDCKKVKWMFVNKHWFTFYLSQIYSTIQISLGNETVKDKIFNSLFDIGKYVKHIKLSNIQKPQNLNLNTNRIFINTLALIMRRTPNVQEVSLFRSNKDLVYQDWLYFSMVLINENLWKLQFLPTLGEDNIFSVAYYYTCAYYSRHTLKKLELSFSMLNSRNLCTLKEFTALESLEVHNSLLNGLDDLGSLLQYTPKIQELIVRFASNRSCLLIKKEYKRYSSIKKLWLYNFTPQHNDELLALVKEFPALQNLYIFGEKDKKWLSNIKDPLIIENFFSRINLIPMYEIMLPGDNQEIEFSESWLKSISRLEQDAHLLHTFKEHRNQNHLRYGTNTVATFYSGSAQSTPYLKYAIMGTLPLQLMFDILRVLNNRSVSCFRVTNVEKGLNQYLNNIIDVVRIYLKQIAFFNCTLDVYTPMANIAPLPRHIKRIIFRNCKIYFLPFKSFINEFKSLDYVEFDSCTFGGGDTIDMSNIDIKSTKISNFQKMLSDNTYTNTVQTIGVISVYFAKQDCTSYFTIVDDILIETTKRTFKLFCSKFSSNEAVVFNIKVGSLQELSLKLTKTSKIQNISFR